MDFKSITVWWYYNRYLKWCILNVVQQISNVHDIFICIFYGVKFEVMWMDDLSMSITTLLIYFLFTMKNKSSEELKNENNNSV